MKVRQGFVSNSSSASYIIKIKDIDFHDFCDTLMSDCIFSFDYFGYKSVKEKVEKYVEMAEGSSITSFKEDVAELKERFDKLDEDDRYNLIRFAIDLNGIELSELDYGIRLSHFTSMHNDFDGSMTPLAKEILLYFLFETDYKVNCKRDGDSMF